MRRIVAVAVAVMVLLPAIASAQRPGVELTLGLHLRF